MRIEWIAPPPHYTGQQGDGAGGMCSRRDLYLAAFANLRTPVNRNLWPAATLYREPGQPFLLLSVLHQIGCGRITRNFIEPTEELTRMFTKLWNQLDWNRSRGIAQPFISLQTAGFWTLAPKTNGCAATPHAVRSLAQLRRQYFGARLHEDLFPLLQMEVHRNKFVTKLAETYFDQVLQQDILDTLLQPKTAND